MLENYWKILTVTLITCLWAEELDRLARSQTLFLESAGAPSPPVTTGTTAAFTLHIFSSSSFSLQYFSSFTCSFFQMLLAVTWDCYIYHHCLLLMVLHHSYVWLVCIWSHRVLALTFSTFWEVSRFDPGASSLYTDVPVHYASHMVMVLHVRSACLYLTVRCYVLDGLSCTFAQPASGCGRRRPQTVCVVFRSSCSQPLVGFLDISHSL